MPSPPPSSAHHPSPGSPKPKRPAEAGGTRPEQKKKAASVIAQKPADPRALLFMAYISQAKETQALPALALDSREEHLLNVVGMAWLEAQRLSVTQLTESCPPVMSINSAHRALKKLRQRGLVQLVTDPEDERRKFAKPTELALAFFARMGQLIAQLPAAQKQPED